MNKMPIKANFSYIRASEIESGSFDSSKDDEYTGVGFVEISKIFVT